MCTGQYSVSMFMCVYIFNLSICVCVCTCGSGKSGDEDSVACVCQSVYCSNHPLCMCRTLCTPCRVWDIQTGQMVNELLHHKGKVYSLKFTTKTLVTGSDVSGYKIAVVHAN